MYPSELYDITPETLKDEEPDFFKFLKEVKGSEITDKELEKAIIDADFYFAYCLTEEDDRIAKRAYILLVQHFLQINLTDLSFDKDDDGLYTIVRTSDFNYPTYRKKVDDVETWQHVFEIVKKSPMLFSYMATMEGYRYLNYALPCRRSITILKGRTYG